MSEVEYSFVTPGSAGRGSFAVTCFGTVFTAGVNNHVDDRAMFPMSGTFIK